jgi:hypothetical protein
MTDRELRATIRQRFTALRVEVQERRTELITETEAQLFEQYRAENERADELDRGLKEITDEANRKAVALLREFEDLADGGRWKGGRQAMFEVPRIHRSNADRTRFHRALMAEVDNQTQQALRVLDRQQTTLLRAPDRARTFITRGVPAIVTDLITPARLRDVEARLNAAAMT